MSVIKWGGGILIAGFIVFLLMPQERLDGIAETLKRTSGNAGQACLDYERQHLKDPDSAKLVATSKVNESAVEITYKARNGFGAYDQQTAVCALDAKGSFSEAGTRSKRQIDQSMRQLEEGIACLDGKIAKRRELAKTGMPPAAIELALGPKCYGELDK